MPRVREACPRGSQSINRTRCWVSSASPALTLMAVVVLPVPSLYLLSLLILTPVTSRNILLLPSLPHSIPYRQANVRRRKDAPGVGTATRGSLARLSRLPRRLHADGGASGRVRHTLSTRAGDRGQRAPRAPLPPGAPVPSGAEECGENCHSR